MIRIRNGIMESANVTESDCAIVIEFWIGGIALNGLSQKLDRGWVVCLAHSTVGWSFGFGCGGRI
jgi:hypothetical protein